MGPTAWHIYALHNYLLLISRRYCAEHIYIHFRCELLILMMNIRAFIYAQFHLYLRSIRFLPSASRAAPELLTYIMRAESYIIIISSTHGRYAYAAKTRRSRTYFSRLFIYFSFDGLLTVFKLPRFPHRQPVAAAYSISPPRRHLHLCYLLRLHWHWLDLLLVDIIFPRRKHIGPEHTHYISSIFIMRISSFQIIYSNRQISQPRPLLTLPKMLINTMPTSRTRSLKRPLPLAHWPNVQQYFISSWVFFEDVPRALECHIYYGMKAITIAKILIMMRREDSYIYARRSEGLLFLMMS